MIRPHNNETATGWSHGDFAVQLVRNGQSQPMGYCDGTEEDEQELREIAESEGADELRIEKKQLKSGRQIWTLGDPPAAEYDGD